MKQKNILLIAILLILVVNVGFVLTQEFVIDEDIASYSIEINHTTSEDGKEEKLSFIKEGGFVEIKGVRFENVSAPDKPLNPSFIRIDLQGNILEADLTANEQGSTFIINGIKFEAPPNSRVVYSIEEGFYLEGVGVSGIEKDQFVESLIYGDGVKIFDDLFLEGEIFLNKKSYLIKKGQVVYDHMVIRVREGDDVLIEKDPLVDLSNVEGNWIQRKKGGLEIQSAKDGEINLLFLEGSELFEINNTGLAPNVEHFLSMSVYGGDRVSVFEKNPFTGGKNLISHESAENGTTTITTGRHILKSEKGEFSENLGNLNTKNKLSVNFFLKSDALGSDTLKIDNDNGYVIYDADFNVLRTFDKSRLDDPMVNIESEIGRKMYSYVEKQVGNSAYVGGGTGREVCSKTTGEVHLGFDCIGLIRKSLTEIYSGDTLSDFSPNLGLVKQLEKKGWGSYIVEPAGVQSQESAEKAVKNIPPGSIVFLMHPVEEEYLEGTEGVAYQYYTNSEGNDVSLTLGHTLVRGTGNKNFINAKPNFFEYDLPPLARRINNELREQGRPAIFEGTVREGEFIPQDDYLIIISPPQN